MKILGTIFALFILSNAHALETNFDKLEEMFDVASLPKLESLAGYDLNGRCFERSKPDEPLASLLTLEKRIDRDLGPIAKAKYFASTKWWSPKDFMSGSDSEYSEVQIQDRTLKFSVGPYHAWVRQFEDYSVMALTKKTTKMGHFKMEVVLYCYY